MKTRIFTAVIALPLALAAVFYLPNELFAVLAIVMLGLGAWEWAGFLRVDAVGRTLYLALSLAGFVLLWCSLERPGVVEASLAVAALWWVVATLWVLVYPRGFTVGAPNRLMVALTGLLVLLPTFVAMVVLQGRPDNGPWQLLVVLAMVWAADSGAYFAGRLLGRHKLAPQVSPGKTWEGAVGGLLAGLLVGIIGGMWIYGLSSQALVAYLLMVTVIVTLSIIGDLTESMFKRATDIKDSGSLFPGHGGIMDRIDSLTAACPCYLLGLHYLAL